MRMRRPLLISVGLAVLIAALVNLVRWADTSDNVSTLPVSTSGTANGLSESVAAGQAVAGRPMQAEPQENPAQASAAPVARTILVPVEGTVDGQPESVSFSGKAQVASRLVPMDPPGLIRNPTPTAVELVIDLTHVTGVGLSSGGKYIISGPEIMNRPLDAFREIEITFPFFPSGAEGIMSARAASITFSFSFDITTGAITGATARLINT